MTKTKNLFPFYLYILQEDEQISSRSSTPSSISNPKKAKKNTIAPIVEQETSFASKDPVTSLSTDGMTGLENPNFERSDLNIPRSGNYIEILFVFV